MAGAGVEITGADAALQTLLRLADGRTLRSLRPFIGAKAVGATRTHLERLNAARPNALGGPRTNFYANAATRTSYTLLVDGIVVSINQQGMRQRYYGGTIRPTGGRKFLTLPAAPEAHGKRASDFAGRLVVSTVVDPRTGRPRRALVEAAATGLQASRRKGQIRYKAASVSTGRKAVFWLVRSVSQKPDPSVIPARETLVAAILPDVRTEFARLTNTRS